MQAWVLILSMHGPHFHVALTNVPGFKSFEACAAAGKRAEPELKSFATALHFSCVEVK